MFSAMLQTVVVGFGDLACCNITFTDCSSGCWVFMFAAVLQIVAVGVGCSCFLLCYKV